MSLLTLISRTALSAPFITTGLEAIIFPAGHRSRIANFTPLAQKIGLTLPPPSALDLLTRTLGTIVLTGGIAVLTQKAPKLRAAILISTQIPITIANNPFWLKQDIAKRQDLLRIAGSLGLIGAIALDARK